MVVVFSWLGVGEQLLSGGDGCGVIRGDMGKGLSRLLRRTNAPVELVNEVRKLGETVSVDELPGTNSGACGVTCNTDYERGLEKGPMKHRRAGQV